MLIQDTGQIAQPMTGSEHALQRVLVGFDGSDSSWAALRQAIAVAVGNDAELTIAAVAQMPRVLFSFPGTMTMPYSYDALRKEVEGEMRLHLAEARDEVPASIKVHTVLLRGRAARELARHAESGGYDLLVTGPRPRHRFTRSVTHALLSHSRVSVLAVK
jgi:nucleotide-binding universal stress UspA family protein